LWYFNFAIDDWLQHDDFCNNIEKSQAHSRLVLIHILHLKMLIFVLCCMRGKSISFQVQSQWKCQKCTNTLDNSKNSWSYKIYLKFRSELNKNLNQYAGIITLYHKNFTPLPLSVCVHVVWFTKCQRVLEKNTRGLKITFFHFCAIFKYHSLPNNKLETEVPKFEFPTWKSAIGNGKMFFI
jgi:ribosomal protein S26